VLPHVDRDGLREQRGKRAKFAEVPALLTAVVDPAPNVEYCWVRPQFLQLKNQQKDRGKTVHGRFIVHAEHRLQMRMPHQKRGKFERRRVFQ
jgi:hypothetical protein